MSDISYKVNTLTKEWRGLHAARLGVSLGQPYHEGAKFEALCEWTSKRFLETEVMIADTLQRWNTLAQGRTDGSRITAEWQAKGDAWLERNKAALDMLKGLTVTRWDDYIHRDSFPEHLQTVHAAYQDDTAFRAKIDDAAQTYIERNQLRTDALPFSRGYLFEECAVFLQMNADVPKADIYPGSFFPVREVFGLDNLHFTRVDFTRRKLEVA